MIYKDILVILLGLLIILLSKLDSVTSFLRKVYSLLFFSVPGNTVMREIFSKKDGSRAIRIGLIIFGLMFVIAGLFLLFFNP